MLDNIQRVVLVTGGTKGIGKAIAHQFAKTGCQVVITYGWGSADDTALAEEFIANGCPPPLIFQADVINDDDTEALLAEIKNRFGRLDVFISNVSFANVVKGFDEYQEASLLKSIEYSCWPMIAYTHRIKEVFGVYPNYVIALSSHGPDRFHKNYDFAAATKTLNEVLVKYLTYHLFEEDVKFNVVRTRPVITDSLLSTLGNEWVSFIEKYDAAGTDVALEEVANIVWMLCSGLMDAVRGQTITADKGYDFIEGLQHLYINQQAFGL